MAGRMQQIFSNHSRIPSLLVSYLRSYGRYPLYAVTFTAILLVGIENRLASRAANRPPAVLTGGADSEGTKKSRYVIDEIEDTSTTFVLPDGRKLGYAQFGDLQQTKTKTDTNEGDQRKKVKTILYCHGLPGSRLEVACFDSLGKRLGFRIIAVDRPGYGWSSPHPRRTIIDHAKDIERLAEYLELEEYGVLGISGGGPYALACAAVLPPSKLRAVTIVCGLGPPEIGTRGMDFMHRLGFIFGWPYFPHLTRVYFQGQPGAQLHLSDSERLKLLQQQVSKTAKTDHPKDVEVFRNLDFARLYLRSARESYAQGWDGIAKDGNLVSTDFGFRLEDVRTRSPDLRVRLWYGTYDTFVPIGYGKGIAERLGDMAHLRVEDETHASLFVNCQERFLEDLVACM